MDLTDRLPSMTEDQLKILSSNAERLSRSGSVKQKSDASHLLPLIKAEQKARDAAKPPKPAPVRKPRKVAAKAAA